MDERGKQPTGKAREIAEQKRALALENIGTIPDKLFKDITGLSKAEALRLNHQPAKPKGK